MYILTPVSGILADRFGRKLVLVPSIQNLLVGFASFKERAAFMSVNSMVLRIGQAIGSLLIGVFFAIGRLLFSYINFVKFYSK